MTSSALDPTTDQAIIGTATFTIDRDYVAQKYDDWLHNVSRWRRREPLISLVGMLFCVFLYWLFDLRLPEGALLLAVGVIFVADNLSYRWRVLRKARPDGTTVEIQFGQESIRIRTPLAVSNLRWSTFSSATATPNGLFLADGKTTIYVPDATLSPPSAKADIATRLGARVVLPSATARRKHRGHG